MYAQLNEQFEESLKPVSEMMKINVKALETLTQQQTTFFTTAMNDSLVFTQGLMAQKDVAGVLNAQKEFGEEMQTRMVDSAKEAYATLSEAQEAAAELFKGAFVKAQEAAAEVAPKPAAKKSAK